MKLLTIAALSLLLSGCATTPLSSEEASVRILRKSDPEKTCRELEKVKSYGFTAFTDEAHESNLKRETFKVGGNLVTFDRMDENRTAFGTAYRCEGF